MEIFKGLGIRREQAPKPEIPFAVEGEYRRSVRSLNKTGILSLLPESESLGVLGIDGKEYPMPTPEQVGELFEKNRELIANKQKQGFTKLLMTPLAMPVSLLVDRVGGAIRKHAQEGNIFQTKRHPDDPAVPVEVDSDEPLYMWQNITTGDETGELVYFPNTFTDTAHQGLTKKELVTRPDICAVAGWSIGLIEEASLQAKLGEGKRIGGRKQLENGQSPREYLELLKERGYHGETGWTPEDFLTNFITRLEETNQISNDWDDNNGVWLPGAYLPQEGAVPFGNWGRDVRQVRMYGYYPEGRSEYWGARSTVRLAL